MASDKPGAMALDRAAAAGMPTAGLPRATRTRTGRRATRRWPIGSPRSGADLIVLAGYMQLLTAWVRGALSRAG